MIVAKDTKAILLLVFWLGAVVVFFVGAFFLSTIPGFAALSAGLFAMLGFASAFIVVLPAGREYPSGYCQSCGYDLTGNESGRCPECGLVAWATADNGPEHMNATRDA